VLRALSTAPRHVEEVVVQCGLPYPEVVTALLTLVLEDVLVEGPEGFFHQRNPP
jgi:predicted Rossmann fold nucleotide-binding protein DprA/Smf involved in DNA uptake